MSDKERNSMTKKILFGTVLFGSVGILIVGAVLRTIDKTDQMSASHNGQGRNRTTQETVVTQDDRQGGNQRGARGSSQEPAGAPGEASGGGEVTIQAWVMREGTVEAVDEELLTIALADGETMVIEGRAWSFAQEQAFLVNSGDQLSLEGFWEDGDFVVGHIKNITTGHTVLLREETGRPLWAGGGRRGA
jgi:hypothetical protein